ncbi:type I-B CRISPR-associated protein Cas8b/Csh1 [Anaerophilus nitritogenes]|uniref:type I-B CRISPR-associated protein Cas8b/Csh1 n=1 Tax=Anaerophilus nitritogenes TaxID=2498136 RepID=UPI00101C3E6A|nr:type I-B CRISPR-associated protein Cas8b/Csh1 [Anaerophilus nitritogenes]
MLNQALAIFKKEYEKKGDALILDEYIPADGTYVVVKPSDDGFLIEDAVDIKLDKKMKTIDRTQSQYMDFICLADYYSKVTDMNKAILSSSGKVIQGNNYLSFIIKKESLTNGKLTEEIIDKYYSYLENPRLKYDKKAKALDLYQLAEEKVGQVNQEQLNKIKVWIKENLFALFKEYTGKDYLKIFFYYPEDYKKESERYFIPNIYNNNDYNQKVGNMIYGLPNDNMGLNSKKPYLENKTRKVTFPYLIDQEEVLYQKKFFDYLMNQASAGKLNIYMGEEIKTLDSKNSLDDKFSGIFLRIKKGKEVEIQDYDIISKFNPNFKDPFEYKNILGIDYDRLNASYEKIKTLKGMEKFVNEVMFSKYLSSNYFTEPKDIKINDGVLKFNILMCRTELFNWFYKGNGKNIWILLKKASLSLVKGSIKNGYMTKAADQFNFRLSLKEYFEGGEEMTDVILEMKNKLREKISQKNTSFIENDREYFFAVGQLVSFFISRSKGKKKPLSLANPFINAKRDKVIKEKLKALYKKYNYDIESYSFKFKGLYAMVMSYELENKIDEDMIIAGYLHSNLLYEKLEKEEPDKDKQKELGTDYEEVEEHE